MYRESIRAIYDVALKLALDRYRLSLVTMLVLDCVMIY